MADPSLCINLFICCCFTLFNSYVTPNLKEGDKCNTHQGIFMQAIIEKLFSSRQSLSDFSAYYFMPLIDSH